MTGPAEPIIILNASRSTNKWLALLFIEAALVCALVADFSIPEIPAEARGALKLLRLIFTCAAAYYWFFAPDVQSQSLNGSKFRSGGRHGAVNLRLLEEIDLMIKAHGDGNMSIYYWSLGQKKRVRVLPDPTGRMQNALIEIGRQLPPGQFVDERRTLGEFEEA